MTQTSLEQWASQAYALAQEAGEAIMQIYEQPQAVIPQYKEDNSPLTVADQTAHEILFRGLSQLLLDGHPAPVLSEEGKQIPFVERQKWERYWCVDPLDGTKDFLAHNDEFTVNIALVINHQPVIGIVFVPAQKSGYLAWRGGGAYHCKQAGEKVRLVTQKPPQKPIRVLVSRYHGLESLQPWIASLGETTLIHQGSALKFCTLAASQADLFLRLSPSSEWDNAAGQCILEEAGGSVFTWDLEPLPYNRTGTLEQRRFIAVADPSYHWHKFLNR